MFSIVGDGFKTLFLQMHCQIGGGGPRLGPNSDVAAYRDFVLQNQALIDVPERGKCNRWASELRQEGNRLFLSRKFDDALAKFNESICAAEPGTEHLGMGFANRSAVYYEMDEYEYCLANIELAKRNHYPEKFAPKLEARELACRAKLDDGQSKGTTLNHSIGLNVSPNPKIPFIADGIVMKRYPGFGRGLAAEKDFQPGNIILEESPMLTLVGSRYNYCNNCAGSFQGCLIPCPGCTSAMYCSEECLGKDYRFWHRFECGLAEKLQNVMFGTMAMAPKRFFFGLTAFRDDIQEMMTYCEESTDSNDDPFVVDHTNQDQLEQFKVLHQTKLNPSMPELESVMRLSAATFYAIFMKHPLVKQLVTTDSQKDFMLRCIFDYIRKDTALSLDSNEVATCTTISTLSTISSLVNHSCDPNIIMHIRYGRIRFWVLRPIRKGDQIVASYGPTWWDPQPSYKSIFKCSCPVCDEGSNWSIHEEKLPAAVQEQLGVKIFGVNNPDIDQTNVLKHLHHFFTQYGYLHPNASFGPKLDVCKFLIIGLIHRGSFTLERAKVAAAQGLIN
ncbi:SET and MYND domain-containing protein 4-like [Culex pipiens pallens]|uniref:SET and MYND domain-containing protein 4-like n=1 Tax=Culex pipiens pallens TaxID=42434 RepID=UPI0019538C68|nr:SET and MYND domain-containing protein 4-like [Culex pipiens pallens]